MKLTRFKPCILAILGTAATLSSMSGNVISPGITASPDSFNSIAGMTLLASTGPINIYPVPGTSFNATYTEYVTRDTNNVFCADCLDFILIMVNNAGPGIFERVSTSSFGSFLTDVGYNTAGPLGILPSSVDRSANGNVVGFNFIPPGSAVVAGQNSATLEIQTNATNFAPGFVSIQDGTSGFGAGFQPSAAAPEPASMVLFGSALLAVGFSKKIFSRVKNAS
jgi:hypothetical protein